MRHATIAVGKGLDILWVESTDLEIAAKEKCPEKHENSWKCLEESHGILIPGGFGDRGVSVNVIKSLVREIEIGD